MSITAETKLCMVIGDPIAHSLSPQLHNAGYQALDIADQYVYVACRVPIEKLEAFIQGIRAMGVRGVSCTLPHKVEIKPYLAHIDPIAQQIGAVNTVVQTDGELHGYNTDWLGVVAPLEQRTSLKGKRVAVLGAGGAARAAVYGLVNRGVDVTIYNRSVPKAQALAKEFGCKASDQPAGPEVKDMDIIFNATSLGLERGSSPLPAELITAKHLVFDAVYNPQTRLLRDAVAAGAQVIHGYEMLLHQGLAQFELYTGHKPPQKVMQDVLLQWLYPDGVPEWL